MVAAIAYTLATSVLYFLSPPATTPTGTVTRAQAPRPTPDLNSILASNLFGAAAETAAGPRDEPAVVTRLPLELLATFVAEGTGDSTAIIAQRGRQGLLYDIGEDVPGDATLVEVHDAHVVLRRAGVRETLHFPAPGESFAARSPVTPLDSGMDNTFPDMMDEHVMDDVPTFEDHGDTPPDMEDVDMQDASVRQLVDEYREELEQNPAAALDELGVTPVADGSAEGYRIGDLAHSPYLSQTGLQPGDVILSVNGRPVGDLDQDRLELDNVLAQGSARLEVQRGNRRFFVTASLQ
jgi:general secretion pathway protein C